MFIGRMLLGVCGLGLAVGACGKFQEKDSDETGKYAIPSIDFVVPEPQGNALTAGDGVLTNWQQRFNNITERLNKELELLNLILAKLEGTGSFSDKGAAGNISGKISESSQAAYEYEAVICVAGKPFVHTFWNSDGSKLESTRDLNQSPIELNKADLALKVNYSQDTDKKMQIAIYGDFYGSKPTAADGDFLTEWVAATQTADNEFTLSGVNDWTASKASSFEGDSYLVGKLGADGTGEFLGYAKRLTELCPDAFSESSTNWCLGRKTEASSRFTEAERSEAWQQRLKEIGIASKTKLATVAISGTCP